MEYTEQSDEFGNSLLQHQKNIQKLLDDCPVCKMEARYKKSPRLSQHAVFFSKLFQLNTNIRARNECVFN